jgi:hypothetical protein
MREVSSRAFGDEFARRVSAEVEEKSEAGYGGWLRCTRDAAHDDGEDVNCGTWRVGAELRMALARGVYLARMSWVVWERLWSVQYFHSPIRIFLIEEYRRGPVA